jgi:dethiobiotin synthetase
MDRGLNDEVPAAFIRIPDMKTLFVTGTDTDVGKTWITCAIVKQFSERRLRVGAYKPACSGAIQMPDGSCHWQDVDLLTSACGWTGDQNQICPQRFLAPLAPHIAAAAEQRCIDQNLLATGLKAWDGIADLVVVEGAGGLLCPLSDHWTVLNLAQQFDSPLLIVAGNRLGVINHTLLTVQVAQASQLAVAGVILNDCLPPTSRGDARQVDISRDSNLQQLQHWLPNIPVYRCGHNSQQITTAEGQPIVFGEDGSAVAEK